MHIRLTPEDVKRLYGDVFFVLPEEGAVSAQGVEQDESGTEIQPPPPETLEQPIQEANNTPVTETEPVAEPEVQEPAGEIPGEGQAPQPSPLTQGEKVVWKMRPSARIVLIMTEQEYQNRGLTIVLKDCVMRAGLPVEVIGFGKLPGEGPHWDFREIPVKTAVIFASFPGLDSPQQLQEATLYLADPVVDIVLDPAKQEALVALLKSL